MAEQNRLLIFVWVYPHWGGSQVYLLSLIEEARRDHDILVLVPRDSDERVLETLRDKGLRFEVFGEHWMHEPSAGPLKKLALAVRKLRSENDIVGSVLRHVRGRDVIVHADIGFWQSLIPLIRLSRRTDFIAPMHTALPGAEGIRGKLWRLRGKTIARERRFHVLASNNEARESLYQYMPEDFVERVRVAYSGFDAAEISAIPDGGEAAFRGRFNIADDELFICTVGQFIERKGRSILLKAAADMRKAGLKFKLVWFGTSAVADEDRAIIAAADVFDSFRLVGADECSSRVELLSAIKAADVFILTSLQEGLPLALVEAMALGKPSIATRINAIPEAIEHGRNGILIKPGNSNAVVEALTALAKDPGLRERLGMEAKRTAFDKFERKRSAAVAMRLYNEVFTARDEDRNL